MNIRKVGVAGCGLMGSGIAQVAAQSGFPTVVLEVDRTLLEKGKAGVGAFLARGVEKGKITAADRDAALGRMSWTTDVKDLAACDLVIEAIVEDLGAKHRLFEALDRECGPEAIFASNTSSLSITEMAAGTRRPTRFLGLHFFNPVPLMPLVEVVRTLMSDERVFESAVEFGARLGKTPIRTSDRTGFVVNRLLVPYLLDAVRALEEGVGSITDIDNGMKLGCGYPMGPFTLLDLVGLDTTASIAEIFYQEFREARYATPPLLRRMVMSGFLGKKSGKGFYGYSTGSPVPNDFLLAAKGRGA
jgi:3-hydroxybutyryl-CoA dehydrogenase